VTLTVCPIAVVEAPVEEVWALLAHPAAFDRWWDARTVRITPPGPSHQGQVVDARSAGIVPLRARVEGVEPRDHTIVIRTTFPLGLSVRTEIRCVALAPERSRVSFG
jgi:uncharacterized protein YndB with AHSA1/START domain